MSNKQDPKPHSFCETPKIKCTLNYCDENGCLNRVRHLVEPKQESLEDLLNKKAKQSNRVDLDAYANGLNDGAKWQQKKDLINMVQGDEELGLYKIWVKDAEKESNLSDLNDKANAFWSGYRAGVKAKERMYNEQFKNI